MEDKKLLIGKNEEDVEMAAERATVLDASPEYKSESKNKTNIKQSTRPQTGSLITIISITIWVIFIKKTETTINKSKFNKWKQNAITVAGGKGEGQQLNQLNRPFGIFIDKNKNIFIADCENHRIIEWKYNAKQGQVIAGGNGKGNRTDQLNCPTDVIVDEKNHSIIISDMSNRRVIQWLNQTQQILIHNINCYGLAMDKYGYLYVSDTEKNEVRRWKMGEYNEGTVVAGGNSQGNKRNQLDRPAYTFVDIDQSVYVSDWGNDRVMKWRKDTKEGRVVAGGNCRGGNLNQLFFPEGVIVDDLGQIYVVDSWNNRIMRWCEGKRKGEIVVGGKVSGNQSNQLRWPTGLSSDDEGNLYVVDPRNNRIQKFEIVL
ncbi:unnamed protein product [Adineta steineri]|uniref:Uncharacterized protein n=1 Tax=Adineta steineri TaxID=433720 RepID=A0A819NG11_9BILA|nr:unnamed protein product [Adineta steineri]CAF3994257.1 unnamed protein product [Adineta steineri]